MPIRFHRLSAPSYALVLPADHDWINDPAANGDPGIPANVDAGKKASDTNQGTYFNAWQEDATSANANRAEYALAENTDLLDDLMRTSVPVMAEVISAAGAAPIATLPIVGDVFVGVFGTDDTNQDELNQLILVVHPATGRALEVNGTQIKPALIHDGTGVNVVGQEATGFHTNPSVDFSPNIPALADYKIIYLKRSNLADISQADVTAFTRNLLRSVSREEFTGGSTWLDGTFNLGIKTLDYQLKKIITDLSAQTSTTINGAAKIGAFAYVGTGTSLSTGTVNSQLKELADELGGLAAANTWTQDQTFDGDLISSAGNHTPDISQARVAGDGVTASRTRRIIGQQGRHVAAGTNNDGGDVELDMGLTGDGGSNGAMGKLIRAYGITGTGYVYLEKEACSGIKVFAAGPGTTLLSIPIGDGEIAMVEATIILQKSGGGGEAGSVKYGATIKRIAASVTLEGAAQDLFTQKNVALADFTVSFSADGTSAWKLVVSSTSLNGNALAFVNWKTYPVIP